MQLERKALYNLLRMNWLRDQELDVEPWQVRDYREESLDDLLTELQELGVGLDQVSFLAFSEKSENPEELTDSLTEEEWDVKRQDKVYLIIFELWRRLLPEALCLSVFCDELDHQINLCDSGEGEEGEEIQDVLESLRDILDQNTDEGAEPKEVFSEVANACANDVESFLYDYISEQIDDGNYPYASELIDGLYDYVKDVKWFDYLKARVVGSRDIKEGNELIWKLVDETKSQPNLELYLEILSFLVQGGERELFQDILKISLPIVEVEEDFQDLLQICIDYHCCLDHDAQEQALRKLLDQRKKIAGEEPFSALDPMVSQLLKILQVSDSPKSSV